ncbi:lytic transglycosylase [Serpens gallinarum]|uniref:LysM peptidoglycan-binding domain-containing protein n=1 Tax=Serpens gallinarum TaxID=2763075 RepID=A0ABR8TT22_9PSED|nr:LysM peptidoglycan-binding domain-containing protein [Serpens gallinarum]MBD7978925.1 LysM peptidoglycan-binding domain-containing protein [Serpens gallinarum]
MSLIASKLFNASALAPCIKTTALLFSLFLAGCQNLTQTGSAPESGEIIASGSAADADWLPQPNALITPPEDIWERMRAGFKMQEFIEANAQIDYHRQQFIDYPRSLEVASERASLYIHYIVERLEERDLPLELALLPVIESAYDPLAYSRAHAVGLWQFIPATGRHFNLRQTNWYDGRRDITASTDAALNYLSRLNTMFNGDWMLALAAYNAGEGTVGRAIARNRSAGKPTDFWSLPLPRETRNYVPKFLALSQLVMSPEEFGVALSPIANEPYFEVVEIKQRMDLRRAAKLAEIDEQELYMLNPAFKRRITMDGPKHLLVPTGNVEILAANLAEMPEQELVDWHEYKVRSGDSLYTIARRNNLTVGMLQEINRLSGSHLRIGQVLSIPSHAGQPARSTAPTNLASHTSGSSYNYRVKNGDSLWTIARAHQVSVKDLQRWNKLSGNNLRIDQVLTLHGGTGKSTQTQTATLYKVREGDSLYRIAKRFNVNLANLQSWNPSSSSSLKPGQTLTLYLAN